MDTAGRIRAKRDAAAQARRLALGVLNPRDHARMLALADELSDEADALQRDAPQGSPPGSKGAGRP